MSQKESAVEVRANVHNYMMKFHKVCGILGLLLAVAGVVFVAVGSESNEMMALGIGGLLMGILIATMNLMEGNYKSTFFGVKK